MPEASPARHEASVRSVSRLADAVRRGRCGWPSVRPPGVHSRPTSPRTGAPRRPAVRSPSGSARSGSSRIDSWDMAGLCPISSTVAVSSSTSASTSNSEVADGGVHLVGVADLRCRRQRQGDAVPGLLGPPGRRAEHQVGLEVAMGEPGPGGRGVGVTPGRERPVRVGDPLRVGRLGMPQDHQRPRRHAVILRQLRGSCGFTGPRPRPRAASPGLRSAGSAATGADEGKATRTGLTPARAGGVGLTSAATKERSEEGRRRVGRPGPARAEASAFKLSTGRSRWRCGGRAPRPGCRRGRTRGARRRSATGSAGAARRRRRRRCTRRPPTRSSTSAVDAAAVEDVGQHRDGDPAEREVERRGRPSAGACGQISFIATPASAPPQTTPRMTVALPGGSSSTRERGVGAGDEDEDHRVVEPAHDLVAARGPHPTVVERADPEQPAHGQGVDGAADQRRDAGPGRGQRALSTMPQTTATKKA